MIQVEPLELLFERGILGKTVVAHAPVGTNWGLEHIQRNILCPHAQIGGHERRDDHVLADGAKTRRVLLAFDVHQLVVVIEFVLAGTDGAPSCQESLPNRVRVRAVVVVKRRWPSQHRRREVARLLGRFVHVVLKVVVVTEEALVVAADGAVGRQFQLEVPNGLQRRAGVECLAVRLCVLVVQVGLLHKPTVGRSLVGVRAFSKPIAKHVGLLVAQQERQSWRVKSLVKPGKGGAWRVARQQGPLIPRIRRAHVVQPHGKSQNVLKGVDVALFLFLLFFNVAKPIATLVAHFPVFRPGATLVVDLLQVGNLVVEVLQVGLRVEADVAAVLNRVAQGVLRKRCAVPAERALVAGVEADPIGQREFVERKLVRPIDLVVVGREFTALHEAGFDRIPIVVVSVGVVHLAGDFASVFQDKRLGTSLVIELQRLGQVILDCVIPVPVPGFHHLRNDDGLQTQTWIQHLHVVAHLTHLIHALHLVGRRDLLGQEVEVEILDEL